MQARCLCVLLQLRPPAARGRRAHALPLQATRTWLLVYSAAAARIPMGPHLLVQTASWATLCLRARRNLCETQVRRCGDVAGGWGKGVRPALRPASVPRWR